MDGYVNCIIATAKDLNGVGFPISEKWVGSFLLAGLGDEYKPMIMALENFGTPITGDAIRTKLLQELLQKFEAMVCTPNSYLATDLPPI